MELYASIRFATYVTDSRYTMVQIFWIMPYYTGLCWGRHRNKRKTMMSHSPALQTAKEWFVESSDDSFSKLKIKYA